MKEADSLIRPYAADLEFQTNPLPAAETMAKIVAERPVAELESSGFVVMRKPVPVGGAGDNPWARTPAAKAVPRNF